MVTDERRDQEYLVDNEQAVNVGKCVTSLTQVVNYLGNE